MKWYSSKVMLTYRNYCGDRVVLLKPGIKNYSSSSYQWRQPWYFHKKKLNHWTSRICIKNCTFRSYSKNWKEHQKTQTIGNQCVRNKWKINIRQWKNGLWPSTSTKGTRKYWLVRVDISSNRTSIDLDKGRNFSIFSRIWWHWLITQHLSKWRFTSMARQW